MNGEELSNIIPFAGSGLVGYAIGFLAGMFFVGVQLLQKYGYVSAVACAHTHTFPIHYK